MRILIHSNGPMVPTGYGSQCWQLLQNFRALGHLVACSAFYGVSGSPIRYRGFRVYPAGQADYGVDVLLPHAGHMKADLILTLMDFYKLAPIADQLAASGIKVAAWLPNDCRPLGRPDRAVLQRSRAFPIAMSHFGHQNLIDAGFADAAYVPHGIDTTVFAPPQDRQALRQELGIDDRFVIGICAANRDSLRKGFPEQFEAFRRFRADHPEAVLMLHSVTAGPGGFDLMQLATDLGIAEAVIASDQYAQVAGLMSPEMMAAWYGALDVLSNCSYGEGFGIPIIEAQACGTPVIVTTASAMPELTPYGWHVDGEPFWNPVHRAWWSRPPIEDIVFKYRKAYRLWGNTELREDARKFAVDYDARRIAAEQWAPLLKQLEEA